MFHKINHKMNFYLGLGQNIKISEMALNPSFYHFILSFMLSSILSADNYKSTIQLWKMMTVLCSTILNQNLILYIKTDNSIFFICI